MQVAFLRPEKTRKGSKGLQLRAGRLAPREGDSRLAFAVVVEAISFGESKVGEKLPQLNGRDLNHIFVTYCTHLFLLGMCG